MCVHEWVYHREGHAAIGNPSLSPLEVGWTFYDPASTLPATLDPDNIWPDRPRAVTITEVGCITDVTSSTITINLQRDDGTPADILSADLVCDTNGQTSCASGCDVNTIQAAEDNVAVSDRIDHTTVSVGGTAPNGVSVWIEYTED